MPHNDPICVLACGHGFMLGEPQALIHDRSEGVYQLSSVLRHGRRFTNRSEALAWFERNIEHVPAPPADTPVSVRLGV